MGGGGGGAIMKGVARLVGAGAAIGASASSSPVALCHARSSDPARLLTLEQQQMQQDQEPSSKPLETPIFDLHRFSDEEQEGGGGWTGVRPRQRVVFAPAPTAEEVEAATKELQAALHLSIPLENAGESDEHFSPRNTLCVDAVEPRITQDVMDVSQRPPSTLANPLGLFAAGSSSVFYAFRLLQSNSQVQDVVKSLARDPAIWNAVTNNEKVVEMIQNLQHDVVDHQPSIGGTKEDKFFAKIASLVWDYVLGATLQLLGKVVDIIGSMFGSVEKTFVKDSADVDKMVTSCVMLAVAVLIIVVIKRAVV